MTQEAARQFAVSTAESMRELGAAVGRVCRGGDVLALAGELGAGKTTFTQGLAEGLGISDAITSPTFVVAREHLSPSGGPGLVHVDAYRLGSALELDDLGLDGDLAASVVVVEWGGGLGERLSPSCVDVLIERSDDEDDEIRSVRLVVRDARWGELLADDSRWPS